jgi:hypothetical protein
MPKRTWEPWPVRSLSGIQITLRTVILLPRFSLDFYEGPLFLGERIQRIPYPGRLKYAILGHFNVSILDTTNQSILGSLEGPKFGDPWGLWPVDNGYRLTAFDRYPSQYSGGSSV